MHHSPKERSRLLVGVALAASTSLAALLGVLPAAGTTGPGVAAAAGTVPTSTVPAPNSTVPAATGQPDGCGTQAAPAAPEALQVVNAPQAWAMGDDGAGVTVAVLADGLSPSNPDLYRNAAYGTPGAPVVTQYRDFSGDGTEAVTDGQEAFGDVSSIAAQGNQEYDISRYVNPSQAARLPAAGCWVKVLGVAPGADVMALKVLPLEHDLTISAILQGIHYAVAHGANVITESFGLQNFPDTSLDALRQANNAAIAAGVTVVVASGDGGPNSTTASPATGPGAISVGSTTTLATYAQTDTGGFDNPVVGNGQWADDNISSFSSGGFSQAGTTLTMVAPGDANWALCSTNTTLYQGCADALGGTDIGLQMFGGTSEAAPLTAAAAADVIQAYTSSHNGAPPSPAEVKDILTSTAVDTGAPATEQGAGLLDVAAAVEMARAAPAQTGASGGVLVNPGQLNVQQRPGETSTQRVALTNTGTTPAQVDLSTRALAQEVFDSGQQSFTMSPTAATTNSGTFAIWDGVTEVYQAETFTLPANPGDRLVLSADYQDSGQTSDLHVALFEPDGTYAAYSAPQGLADYAQVEVAGPPAGTWTALFFTEQDGASSGGTGTSGPVQWSATTWAYAPASPVVPSTMTLAPGQTATAEVDVAVPAQAGDSAESLVVSSTGAPQSGGNPDGTFTTTVPVTVRATMPLGPKGGTFSGTVTGGDGRPGVEVQTNTYQFEVPPGKAGIEASVTLANDAYQPLVAYLVNQDGKTLACSSNFTLLRSGQSYAVGPTRYLDLYHVRPGPGLWSLVLEWVGPVTGHELSEPFTGSVHFGQVPEGSNLPDKTSTTLTAGKAKQYKVVVHNTGLAPEAYFVDARLARPVTVLLPDQNSSAKTSDMSLPLGPGLSFPLYIVPTHTTSLTATITRGKGKGALTFDLGYYPGDPDVSPTLTGNSVTATTSARSASATVGSGALNPGTWAVNPDETGPYPTTGAPATTASLSVSAVTQAFDPAVTASTDDLWRPGTDFSHFLYLAPGQSGTITVTVRPKAKPGAHVSGTLYVDDFILSSLYTTMPAGGDQVAAVHYSYTVKSPSRSS